MTAVLEDALRRYKSGDFGGVVWHHAANANRAGSPQMLMVLMAQSHLKLGQSIEAAGYFRRAGEAPGKDQLNYFLISGNLYIRHSMIAEAYAVARQVDALAPRDPKAQEFRHRVLRETCLFDEIETENTWLLKRLRNRDPDARRIDNPFGNISWCGDEAINASVSAASIASPATDAMRAVRHARPHVWADKLRIGYLSDDYYDQHPVMHLFQGTMTCHDTSRFDVTHFCFTSADNIRKDKGKRALYPNLVPMGHLNDEEAASFIRARNIDILVDLKGHTQGCRPNLINLGLAPVQAAYLGYPGSGNGIDCDYVISDRIVTPDSSIPHYHEKFCRLPESYQANDNILRVLPPPTPRVSLGLPEDKIVYAFFNATRKITPETFRLTTEILKRAENSVLWILFFNSFAQTNFLSAAAREGIDPARIICAPKAIYPDHIARLGAADIGLETFPYNGHTTTSDMLWAGVPVVTARGTHFASRVSESLLTAMGVPELVGQTPADYVALSVELAADHEKRRAIRDRIAQNRSSAPLFDTARFTRHLERAYEMMGDRARAGLAPDHIDVPAL